MPKLVFTSKNHSAPTQPTQLRGANHAIKFEPIVINFNERPIGNTAHKTPSYNTRPHFAFITIGLAIGILITFGWFVYSDTKAKPNPHSAILSEIDSSHIAPLPSKIITGRDYTKQKSSDKNLAGVDIVPLLQKLPIGQKTTNRAPTPRTKLHDNDSAIYVEDISPTKSLIDNAEKAALNGETDKAIQLYEKWIERTPQDGIARHNLATLLLDKAAFLDEQGQTSRALQLYQKTLIYIDKERDAASIRARVNYLKAAQ